MEHTIHDMNFKIRIDCVMFASQLGEGERERENERNECSQQRGAAKKACEAKAN